MTKHHTFGSSSQYTAELQLVGKHGSISCTTCDSYGGVKRALLQVIRCYHYFHYRTHTSPIAILGKSLN